VKTSVLLLILDDVTLAIAHYHLGFSPNIFFIFFLFWFSQKVTEHCFEDLTLYNWAVTPLGNLIFKFILKMENALRQANELLH
jgi:hypothetical protein